MKHVIRNAKVVTPQAVVDKLVVLDNGRISGLHDRLEPPADAEVIDAKGRYLSPGFVDIHVHGGGGREVMECVPEAVAVMCRAHLAHGTTSMLPTLSAAPMDVTLRAVDTVRAAVESGSAPNARGIYLEGPFLSPRQAGAQDPASLLVPAETDWAPLLARWKGVRMIGVAPELDGAYAFGDAAAAAGVTVSVAHSDAEYAQVAGAARHGFTDITHLYSGCSSIVRKSGFRVPGVVEAGLLLDSYTVQVIADLCHLPAELLRLVYKCRGADHISLVTDALPFAGCALEEGKTYLQANGMPTVYEDGVMKMPDRQAFCGSVATADRLVRNLVSIGMDLVDVVRMAATTPARVVGLGRSKGRIEPGYDADLVLFDKDIQVEEVYLAGEPVARQND